MDDYDINIIKTSSSSVSIELTFEKMYKILFKKFDWHIDIYIVSLEDKM